MFKTKRVTCDTNNSEYQLAVDTPEDYNRICKILEILIIEKLKSMILKHSNQLRRMMKFFSIF